MSGKQLSAFWKRYVEIGVCTFTRTGSVFYRPPSGPVFTGLNFDTSDAGRFYVYVKPFMKVLSRPIPYFTLCYHERLSSGRKERWNLAEDSEAEALAKLIVQEALPFLDRHSSTERALALTLEAWSQAGTNQYRMYDVSRSHNCEDIAHLFLWSGQPGRAAAYLRSILNELPQPERVYQWQRDLASRARSLLSLLEKDDDAALQQLTDWGNETVRSLGITLDPSSPFSTSPLGVVND